MEVRAVRADESERLREVRLRALADAPHAFCATVAAETAKPASWWEGMAVRSEAGRAERVFVAADDETWCGMAAAYIPGDSDAPVLWGMWVGPVARGQGVGRALADAIVDWARDNGSPRVDLSVVEGNAAAEALFRSAGFIATGERRRIDADRIEVFMTRSLRVNRSS